MEPGSGSSASASESSRDAIYEISSGDCEPKFDVIKVKPRSDGKETPGVADGMAREIVDVSSQVLPGKAVGARKTEKTLIDGGFSAHSINQALKRAAQFKGLTAAQRNLYTATAESSDSEAGDRRVGAKGIDGDRFINGVAKDMHPPVKLSNAGKVVNMTQSLLRGTWEVCGVHPVMCPSWSATKGCDWVWSGICDTCVYKQEEDMLHDRLGDVYDLEDDEASITSDSYTISSNCV